jgi:CRP-like cAMP-binding protein
VAVVLSELVEQELSQGRDRAQADRRPGTPVPDGAEDSSPSAGSASTPSGKEVLVTATQADLAQLAGSSRESASRFLAVLERAGVISQGRGRLVVHDPEALKQYVF